MITTHALTKRYGRVPVVHEVSFTCAPGTITGFLGPNGAGKSTTLRMIEGKARADRRCCGCPVLHRPTQPPRSRL